jgi:hypothetical protein
MNRPVPGALKHLLRWLGYWADEPPTRLALRVLSLLLVLVVLPVAFVRATHGPTAAQVVAVAQQFGMVCTADATQTDCVEQAGSDVPSRHAVIRPPSGSLAEVATAVRAWSNGFAHDLLG